MRGYTAGQLLRYYRHCRAAAPTSRVLPPGGERRGDWDVMTAAQWLAWFRACLQTKTSRGTDARGKGNRAAKRAWEARKATVHCWECGEKVGERANPNSSHNYCDGCRTVRR